MTPIRVVRLQRVKVQKSGTQWDPIEFCLSVP